MPKPSPRRRKVGLAAIAEPAAKAAGSVKGRRFSDLL